MVVVMLRSLFLFEKSKRLLSKRQTLSGFLQTPRKSKTRERKQSQTPIPTPKRICF